MSRFDGVGARLRRLVRDRAARIDLVVAILLTAGGLATLAVQHLHGPVTVAAMFCVAGTSAVAWRRDAPVTALLVVLVAGVAYEFVTGDKHPLVEPFAILLVVYTVAARGTSRRDLAEAAGLTVLAITAVALVDRETGDSSLGALATHAFPVVVLPFLAGLIVARQRSLTAELAATNECLRSEREVRTRLAAARERARVAREIHDVVAHHMSVMVIQSGAARLMLGDDVPAVRAALQVVAASGQEAITELAKLVDPVDAVPGLENPGGPLAEKLAALLERGGFRASLEVDGTPEHWTDDLDRVAYRVVQEAVTNAFKYGPTQPITVRVGWTGRGLTLRIGNEGDPGAAPRGRSLSGGHGLVGMRERVESRGGTLHAGPRPDGGYDVLVELPYVRPVHRVQRSVWNSPTWRIAAFTTASLVVLELNAVVSRTRTGPLAVNVALVALMCLALTFRRRAPLTFLVAVLGLAVPLTGGVASMDVATLVSTYVFFVPVWTVATQAHGWRTYVGLVLAVGTLAVQGPYWHISAGNVLVSALLTVVVWIGGRIVRAYRSLVAAVRSAHGQLVEEQAERDREAVAAERWAILSELNRQITEEVATMTAHAEHAEALVHDDPLRAAELMSAVEAGGHAALARTRHILGLLRVADEPLELKPPADLAMTR